jgi:hypothetical protein
LGLHGKSEVCGAVGRKKRGGGGGRLFLLDMVQIGEEEKVEEGSVRTAI